MEKEELLGLSVEALCKRKHFLYTALSNGNLSQYAFEVEMKVSEPKIKYLTKKKLEEHYETIRSEVKVIKQEVFSDGNFKRSVAKVIINMLQDLLSDAELKGMFRQGYKVMRGR